MAAMRSGASGVFVLPGPFFGEMGSFAAMARALAGVTPATAALRAGADNFRGVVRPLAGLREADLREAEAGVGFGTGTVYSQNGGSYGPAHCSYAPRARCSGDCGLVSAIRFYHRPDGHGWC